jgi:hypothetical protein
MIGSLSKMKSSIASLGLSTEDEERVTAGNARELLGL